MKLVIQGLEKEEWEAVKDEFGDCTVIEDHHTIHPCTGCFSCWNRTPGQCVIKDGYDRHGSLIHHADEVIVLSRYVYGGFSGFVKNVFDRSLGYVLPQFEVVRGETHHLKRYPEDKPFTFIFYGHDLSDEEKLSARKYVRAVCANIRGFVKKVEFRDCEAMGKRERRKDLPQAEKAMLLNASVRFEKGNSAKFSSLLESSLKKETETAALMKSINHPEELLEKLDSVSDLVLCTPLYVDGLPSQLIRFLEKMEKEYEGTSKRVYVLANMGLYESSQLENLFGQVKQWCDHMGFEYCGGLGISAGELVGGLMELMPFGKGPLKTIAEGLEKLTEAVEGCEKMGEVYAEPYHFPRALFMVIANKSWNITARRNGLKPGDMFQQR